MGVRDHEVAPADAEGVRGRCPGTTPRGVPELPPPDSVTASTSGLRSGRVLRSRQAGRWIGARGCAPLLARREASRCWARAPADLTCGGALEALALEELARRAQEPRATLALVTLAQRLATPAEGEPPSLPRASGQHREGALDAAGHAAPSSRRTRATAPLERPGEPRGRSSSRSRSRARRAARRVADPRDGRVPVGAHDRRPRFRHGHPLVARDHPRRFRRGRRGRRAGRGGGSGRHGRLRARRGRGDRHRAGPRSRDGPALLRRRAEELGLRDPHQPPLPQPDAEPGRQEPLRLRLPGAPHHRLPARRPTSPSRSSSGSGAVASSSARRRPPPTSHAATDSRWPSTRASPA